MKTSKAVSLVGAVGSAGFLLRAGQRTSWLLLVIMLLWVVAPFVAMELAEPASKRWPVVVRTTLEFLSLVLTLGSLFAYTYDALRPRKAQAAFVFVAVPLVSWLVILITVPIAALLARRRAR